MSHNPFLFSTLLDDASWNKGLAVQAPFNLYKKVHMLPSHAFKSHLQACVEKLQASFEQFILHLVQHRADGITRGAGGILACRWFFKVLCLVRDGGGTSACRSGKEMAGAFTPRINALCAKSLHPPGQYFQCCSWVTDVLSKMWQSIWHQTDPSFIWSLIWASKMEWNGGTELCNWPSHSWCSDSFTDGFWFLQVTSLAWQSVPLLFGNRRVVAEWDTGTELVTALEAYLDQNCHPDIHESSQLILWFRDYPNLHPSAPWTQGPKIFPLLRLGKLFQRHTVWNVGGTWPLKWDFWSWSQWPSLQYHGQVLDVLVLPFLFNVTVQLWKSFYKDSEL